MSIKPVMGTTAPGRRRNRSWPEALKREIVAASFAPGSSVSIVVRQYDVNANQVFSWRRRYREDTRQPSGPSAPQLIPVIVRAEQDVVAEQSLAVPEKIESAPHNRGGGCVGHRWGKTRLLGATSETGGASRHGIHHPTSPLALVPSIETAWQDLDAALKRCTPLHFTSRWHRALLQAPRGPGSGPSSKCCARTTMIAPPCVQLRYQRPILEHWG